MRAPAGTPIEIFYSEKLDAAGRASTVGNDLVFGQLQTDYYITRGAGEEVWSPPWESYLRHGNRGVLERAYPAMQKYLDVWIPQWTGKDGDTYAHTLTSGLGDWVPPKGVPTVNALSSTAYLAHLATMAAQVAQVLGETADAARYQELFTRVRTDFNARFLSADGIYRDRPDDPFVQTAQILPLAFDLVPEERRAQLAARLADDIMTARKGHAWVGVIGARHVLPVLTETGHHEVACVVATQTAEPSWGYWTDVAGFTALGEHWPADTRSRNHHFFGAIGQWMYEDLAGMRPLEPGYRNIEFRPEIPRSGIDHVSVSHDSVRGAIATAWRRTSAGLEIDATVPPNATGRVYVPAPRPEAVTSTPASTSPASSTPAARLIGRDGDRIVYQVGSGQYRFVVSR